MKIENLWGKIAVLGVVCLGALLILIYYYGAAGGRLPTAANRYTVHALVEPQQLLKHADVRAAGVTVGEVVDVKGRGAKAEVVMDLEKEVAPVYEDATVLVRQKTLVGENYVELVRGSPQAGEVPDGGTLPAKASLEAVPIDRILNSLDQDTRRAVSTNLKALGGALDGHGEDVNRLAADLAPLTSEGSQVTDILDAQKQQVADLVQQGNTVLTALSDRRGDLTTLLKAARTTASAVSERDQQLRQAFAAFPSTLKQAQGSVGRLSSFSGRATPVVSNLRVALADLTPVVKDLGPTATAANRLFDELPGFTKQADPLLDQLRSFSKVATPTFPALDATLRQANPALKFLAPYNRDLTHFLAVFGGNDYYDKYGGIGRCTCPAGEHSFANFSPAMLQAANILLKSKVVTQIEDTHADAYRPPGVARTAGRLDFDGHYPKVEAEPDAGK
jgi:phospholipid/cholesterol/gamma-HCH transport system substrate-binding protein